MADIEIYYALGTEPILMGAAPREDVKRLGQEAAAIEKMAPPESTAVIGDGARHFFTEMGRLGGVAETTEVVLQRYEEIVEKSRQAFRDRLGAE